MGERQPIAGKFSWFEHISYDPKKAQPFYEKLFGWRVKSYALPGDASYDMILAGDGPDAPIGHYSPPWVWGDAPQWLPYVTVDDVEASAKAVTDAGGKVVLAPTDLP